MRKASEIRVGEVVEFDVGSPVVVREIEEYWTEQEDPHPYLLRSYGKSLVFSCAFGDAEDGVQTLYVRRELSPISGRCVVR